MKNFNTCLYVTCILLMQTLYFTVINHRDQNKDMLKLFFIIATLFLKLLYISVQTNEIVLLNSHILM